MKVIRIVKQCNARYSMVCEDCGATFFSESQNARCPECGSLSTH